MQESVEGFGGLKPNLQKIIKNQEGSAKASVEGFGPLNPVNTSTPKK